jgi:hypothetical protein
MLRVRKRKCVLVQAAAELHRKLTAKINTEDVDKKLEDGEDKFSHIPLL